MALADFMTKLDENVSASEAQVIINRMRNDPLIWKSLENPDFSEVVLSNLGNNLSAWSPAGLAHLVLGDMLVDEHGWEVRKEFQDQAKRLFRDAVRDHRAPVDLKQAAILALGLLEQWQKNASLADVLEINAGEPENRLYVIWRTPLACLYGMVDEPSSLLKALLSKKGSLAGMAWVSHCVLCNPIDPKTQIQNLAGLISACSPIQQVNWLRYLQLAGQATLVSAISNTLLGKLPAGAVSTLGKHAPDRADVETNIIRYLEMVRLAALFRNSGQTANARAMGESAQSILRNLEAGIEIQFAELDKAEQPGKSIERMISILSENPNSTTLAKESMMAAAGNVEITQFVNQIPDGINAPLIEIFRAKVLFDQGAQAIAREKAISATRQFIEAAASQPGGLMTTYLPDWQPVNVAQALVDMGLPQEALACAEQLLEIRPVDIDLIEILVETYQNQRQLREALNNAFLLQKMQPGNPTRHRKTANLLELLEQWQQAKREREVVIQLAQPLLEDWVALGRCQAHLAEWEALQQTCEQIFKLDPENGKGCALKGQALMALGNQDEAVHLLNKATMLAPEEAEPWLALFRMQQQAGEEQRAVETLKAAVLAVPDSSDINFELAKTFLEKGLFTDGLPFLKKAAKLAPDAVDVALDLGRTLAMVGHFDEAEKVLSNARARWGRNAQLAHAYAELALNLGEREKGLNALDVALKSEDAQPDWFLLYARTLVDPEAIDLAHSACERLITAQMGLEKVLTKDPENLEAMILRAEVVMNRSDFAQAYGLYQALMELCKNQPSLCWRVQMGMGEAALHLGLVDNALVALNEAVQSQPEMPKIHCLLAEALKAGNLGQEAAVSARYALKLRPDQLSMLEWFANFIAQMGELDEAITALKTASELAPEKSGYWVGLAELYFRKEDQPAASEALEKMLSLPAVDCDHLRRAAGVFLRLDQPNKAYECLSKAIEVEKNADGQLWVELAYICQLNQKFEESLDAVQNAMTRLPNQTWLSVLQSDLLAQLGKLDGAEACLERAQRAPVRSTRPLTQVVKSGVVPAEWLEAFQQPYAVNLRFARLERQRGNLSKALPYIEAALEAKPDQVELRCLAADIACAGLLPQRGAQLADAPLLHLTPIVLEANTSPRAVVTLLAILGEIALEQGDLDSCEVYLQKGEEVEANLPRLLAARARLASKQGNWQSAVIHYQSALNTIQHSTLQGLNSSLDVDLLPVFWQAAAAMDMMDYQGALTQMHELVKSSPREPRILMGTVKALVKCAEAVQIAKEIHAERHLPAESFLNQENYQLFENLLNQLEASTTPVLVERWRARGRAAFRPSPATLRMLFDLLPGEEEAAALVSALRVSRNLPSAIQVAQEYSNSVTVQQQLALCQLSNDSLEALKAANRAAELDNHHPVNQAILALALQKCGYAPEALEAWQAALSVWDDEPLWQALAGKLAAAEGNLESAINHWKTASALMPESVDFMVELGKVLIASCQADDALQVLERASSIDGERSEVWYWMAEALRILKRLPNALQIAEKAVSLDEEGILPRLLCGEIALQMGNANLAFEFSRQALTNQPFNEVAVLFQVKVLESTNRGNEGLTLLERSITPESTIQMVLAYARLVYQLRGPQAALPMLKKIVQTDPDEVGVLNLLAHAQEECGEMENAEQTAFNALQLQPSQPDLNRLMGRLKRLSGQLDQSVHFLSEAIRLEPSNLDAYIELGKTYQDRREMNQALAIYEKAIAADPGDHRPYYLAGIVLRESKDYQGAEKMLKRASELAPQDVNIRRLLGAVVTLNLIHSSQEVGSLNETH